jgi:hypothetical protein
MLNLNKETVWHLTLFGSEKGGNKADHCYGKTTDPSIAASLDSQICSETEVEALDKMKPQASAPLSRSTVYVY